MMHGLEKSTNNKILDKPSFSLPILTSPWAFDFESLGATTRVKRGLILETRHKETRIFYVSARGIDKWDSFKMHSVMNMRLR